MVILVLPHRAYLVKNVSVARSLVKQFRPEHWRIRDRLEWLDSSSGEAYKHCGTELPGMISTELYHIQRAL